MIGYVLWFLVSRAFGVYKISEAMLDGLEASIAAELARLEATR